MEEEAVKRLKVTPSVIDYLTQSAVKVFCFRLEFLLSLEKRLKVKDMWVDDFKHETRKESKGISITR